MFQADQVKSLNDLESLVLREVLKDPKHIQALTIRAFAGEVHVSTSTIVRLCAKLGFEGWSEFKFYIKNQNAEKTPEQQHYDNMLEFDLFLKRMYSESYQKRLNDAARQLADADYIVFVGIGQSGSLADYAVKYFGNIGLVSFLMSDPYQAVQVTGADKVAVVLLSESGGTAQVLNKALEFKEKGATLLSITNAADTPIAKLADLSLSYNLADEWSERYPLGNLTTQLPTLAILEILAHKVIGLK